MLSLSDRSRLTIGWGRCARARWLEFHSGPTGYGMRLKRTAMPLATGLYVHEPLADILNVVKAQGSITRPEVRGIVEQALDRYTRAVRGRGFVAEPGEPGGDEQLQMLAEQCSLVEGFVWGFYRVVLPTLQERYHILSVEAEGELVLGCTCGLGDVGSPDDHEARDCNGTIFMTRPDALMQDKVSLVVINLDHKTGGSVKYKDWQDQWADSPQLLLNSLGAEKQVGAEIPWAFIFGLHKGARKTRGEDGMKWQDSPLCYAWRKPANPPMWGEEWAHSFNFIDDDGHMRTLKGKGFDRAPVWEAQFPGKPPEWRTLEYWVDWLPEQALRELFVLLGPLPKPQHLEQRLLNAIPEEEARWRSKNWRIYEALVQADGQMDDPQVQQVLDQEAPQSWECRRYRGMCQFYAICKQQEGWTTPLESGRYELRRPHHARELAQMQARGITPPLEQWEDEEDQE